MSCPECAGHSLVSPCPICTADDVADEMVPIEAGRYARECCHGRESNPWINADDRAAWFEGWDEADAMDEADNNEATV